MKAHEYEIITERLKLRPMTVEDSIEVFNGEYHFGFVRLSDGELIGSGSIGPSALKEGFWAFGYNFRYDCWGLGYATEATKAMIDFVKTTFGVTRFCSSHVEPNIASGHVMEKCGLHFSGYGEFEKLDGTCKSRSKEYEMIL